MFRKFLASVQKEIILLTRDKAGLALLFLMPLALIIIVTVIQDNTFRSVKENSIKILFLNLDKNFAGDEIKKELQKSGIFEVEEPESKVADAATFGNLIKSGKYQIGVIVPKDFSQNIKHKITSLVNKHIYKKTNLFADSINNNIQTLFDPAVKASFRNSVASSLGSIIVNIQTRLLINEFSSELGNFLPINKNEFVEDISNSLINNNNKSINSKVSDVLPDSVQHNVPAWTIFAIFFMVIPLSGNMLRERDEGSGLRLKMMPFSYAGILLAKLAVYEIVCLFQFILITLAGKYLLPVFGIASFNLPPAYISVTILVLAIGLAASGYSLLIGTVAKTQEQASVFGAISVMILAAIGGIWVPVYGMPAFMRLVSKASPLNWALEGFYDLILRNGTFWTITPYLVLLTGFFILMLLTSFIAQNLKK